MNESTDLDKAIQALSACTGGLRYMVKDGRLYLWHGGRWVDGRAPVELRAEARRYRAQGMAGLADPVLAVADAMDAAVAR